MENEIEIWKPTKGFEGLYEVSSLGNVKILSVMKLNGRYMSLCKEKIMKPNSAGVYLRVELQKNGFKKQIGIHQLVAESFLNHTVCGNEWVVNHINFNKLDNRLCNLEVVTNRENSNRKHLKSTSQYVGVHWHKATQKWASSIDFKGKQKHLGVFKTELEAHLAYEKALSDILY